MAPINFITPPFIKVEYANLVRTSHSPSEMVLEFARILPGEPNPVVVSKLVITPQVAKLLQMLLADNLAHYEQVFGEIKLPASPATLADQLFKSTGPDQPPGPDSPKDNPGT